ncbi:HtaA domain-containing protein [Nocardioides carbamazepini]|uniref:HtaA domain-containing protein n=1 Tax=Nocardioides carbamazepini TaxID=2854259 RepID=UPI00214A0EEF|nr:HtaA domain-containing protein [Nocardioides carbamazepini]MCR1784553.1 HtaA domain-containing protein [Nocardioides carbamazepini]
MKSARRGIAGIAAAALTATGLSVLGVATAPSAHAEAVSVDNAVFRWGINKESGSAGFAPGTWNLMSAGKVGNPGAGGQTLKTADNGATWSNGAAANWTNTVGNVTVEDLQSGGGYAPTSFLGTRQNAAGENGTTANGQYGENELVFRNGTGTIDSAANTASVQWDGDATILYYSGMTFFYVSDPKLTVNPDGSGSVTATVDGYASDMNNLGAWTDLADEQVTLATLSDVDVDDLGLTTTPDYLEVEYDASSDATPQSRTGVNWGSFPQSFVDFAQKTGAGSYWYSSGGGADARKPTLPLSVSFADAPAVSLSAESVPTTGEHQVTVTGTGFDPSLSGAPANPPGLSSGGVYVALGRFSNVWRPSGSGTGRDNLTQKWALPPSDHSNPALASQVGSLVALDATGRFEVTFTVSKAAFDAFAANPGGMTGVFTYTRKTNLPSFETYSPITFAAEQPQPEPKPEPQKPTPSATVALAKKPNAKGKKGSVTISSTGLAGQQVTVVVKQTKPKPVGKKAKKKATKTITVTIDASGTTTVALPKLGKGTHKVTVTYPGGSSVTKVKVKGKK